MYTSGFIQQLIIYSKPVEWAIRSIALLAVRPGARQTAQKRHITDPNVCAIFPLAISCKSGIMVTVRERSEVDETR